MMITMKTDKKLREREVDEVKVFYSKLFLLAIWVQHSNKVCTFNHCFFNYQLFKENSFDVLRTKGIDILKYKDRDINEQYMKLSYNDNLLYNLKLGLQWITKDRYLVGLAILYKSLQKSNKVLDIEQSLSIVL